MTQQEQRGFEKGKQEPEQRTAELRAEIAQTRERLADDIGAISEKFTAEHAKGFASEKTHQAAERVKSTMRRAGHTTSVYARDNALPLTLCGIGMIGAGWLVMNARRSRQIPSYPRYYQERSYASARQHAAETLHEPEPIPDRTEHSPGKVKRAIGDMKDRVGHLGHEAKIRAQDAGHRAREQMSHGAHRASDSMSHLMEEKPLVLGAVAFAAGIGLGLLLPTIRQEERWFGPARERLIHRAEDKLRAAKHVAERTVEQARSTAREEAAREGLTPTPSSEWTPGRSETL